MPETLGPSLEDFDLSFSKEWRNAERNLSTETEKAITYFPHFDDAPDRHMLLPLNYWEKDQEGRPTLWVVGKEDQKEYPEYGNYRYDIPSGWLEGARPGNTET